MKKEFNITKVDRTLLSILIRLREEAYTKGMEVLIRTTVLQVLGEKHGFKPETAESHPTEDLIIAEPAEPKICLT